MADIAELEDELETTRAEFEQLQADYDKVRAAISQDHRSYMVPALPAAHGRWHIMTFPWPIAMCSG